MPIEVKQSISVKPVALPARTALAKDLPIRERADDTHDSDPLGFGPKANPPVIPVGIAPAPGAKPAAIELEVIQRSLPPLAPGIPPLFSDRPAPAQPAVLAPSAEVVEPNVNENEILLDAEDPVPPGAVDADMDALLAVDVAPPPPAPAATEVIEDESVEPTDTWGHLDFFQAADAVQTDLSAFPEDDLENFLMSFFLLVPSPEDIQVHLLAKSLGLQPDILEGVIYQVTQKLMQTNLNQGEPNAIS